MDGSAYNDSSDLIDLSDEEFDEAMAEVDPRTFLWGILSLVTRLSISCHLCGQSFFTLMQWLPSWSLCRGLGYVGLNALKCAVTSKDSKVKLNQATRR